MSEEYCPTQSGTFQAYQIEYFDRDDGWRPIPIKMGDNGIPFPSAGRGILETIGLYGLSQAHTLAWQFSAGAEARGISVDVRVVAYKLQYDIKAKRMEEGQPLSFIKGE